MKVWNKIVGTTLAVALSLGVMGASAQVSDTGDAQVEIINTTGVLSVAITDQDFGQHEYSFTDRTVPGSFTITVSDTRGSAAGWQVTLSGTDFTGTAGTFGIGQLSLQPGTVTRTGGSGVVPTLAAAAPVNGTGTVVLDAAVGTGDGAYDNVRDASLVIPGGTRVGVYNSTLTVTATSAP